MDETNDTPRLSTEKASQPQGLRERSSSLQNRAGVSQPAPDLGLSQPAANQPKTPAFREVLALKDSHDRIGTFKLSRDQLAQVDSGLAHWINSTALQLPDVRTNAQGQPLVASLSTQPQASNGPSSAKTNNAGGAPAQPYFQQYLNFSSSPGGQTSASPGAQAHGPQPAGGGSGEPPSATFSPSGLTSTRLTRSQVEARGKDLLHTAGLFSGKANVAAKGLFAKGKSRFRASGSGEKVDH
jgi:hypothetical protein